MADFIISIDQGTTSSRAILFNLKGKPVYSSQKEFTQYFPKSGWVEHNPEEIWSTTKKTLKDVINKAKRLRGNILTIGITNQRETSVLWDKKTGKAVYKAIVWQDEDLGAKFVEEEIPSDLAEKAKEYRQKLIELAIEQDDKLMEAYLEGNEPSVDDIKNCIRKGTIKLSFVPVFCGSAFKNKGVQLLLDAVVDYLPSPIDIPPVKGSLPNSEEEVTRKSDDSESFSLLAFKVMNDPFVGSLTFCRVYSGVAETGSTLLNSTRGKRERLGRMLLMHANSREDITEARAGDIVAIAGLKDTYTGDTLCDQNKTIVLEKMDFPDPVIEVAVEPKTKADQEKMSEALQRLAKEDPSFRVSVDHESTQTIIKGMGELHLDIIVDRLKREFQVEANVGAPQVAYRETITKTIDTDYIHKKQSGGAGQFARVVIEFTPLDPGEGFVFDNKIVGGKIPKEYIPGVEKGL